VQETHFNHGLLRRAIAEFIEHYHFERNHQGKGNVLLFASSNDLESKESARGQCRERLGGLLKYYHSRAA